MDTGHYWKSVAPWKAAISEAIPRDELADLHRCTWWRHYALVARQIILVAIAIYFAWTLTNPLLWVPLSIYIGFTAFNFTVLLHEVVHSTLFATARPGIEKVMGFAYAIPSGISRSQFTRWHLDHHDQLGTDDLDPKRHWLSPKVVKRWYKLLYCSPVLFPIYFRAAAREAATYPKELARTIKFERTATILVHLTTIALLLIYAGPVPFMKVYAIPYFLVFPVAFTLNRLGQHYNIDPERPLNWSTLMKASRLWDFLFLYSNYHLEHHYFPRVPFYNLRRLHFALADFYRENDIKAHTYREILWGWFVENRPPHKNWDAPGPG